MESDARQAAVCTRPLGGGGNVGERFSVDPPIEPMLAKPIAGLPESADGLAFQPKWDGFRVIVYRRGDDVVIQGRMRAADAAATGSWDLSYAFPEMVERIRGMRADDVVLDGELVVIREGRLAFDALQGRLRPRKEEGGWKIAQLAADFPTSFVAFDILAVDGKDLRSAPFAERRAALLTVMAGEAPPLHLTPQTDDLDVAARWFAELPGAGLDGLIARPLDGVYAPGKRTLFKIKPAHTVDVVCAGWRPYKQAGPDGGEVVGSVLIGLYDEAGVLQMIGAMSAFPMAQRVELAARFADLAAGSGPSLVRARGPGAGDAQPLVLGAQQCVEPTAARSWSPRSRTTRWSRAGCATSPRWSAGARTRPPRTARWTGWSPPSRWISRGY